MVRPRNVSDTELLQRIAHGLSDQPGSWSLDEAAQVAKVHPATLVKRFGSKHALLVELSRRWSAAIPDGPLTDDCLAELRAWVEGVARPPQDRSGGVAGLAMLLEDLKNDELSRLLAAGWERQIAYLSVLIAGSDAVGELPRAPEPAIAAALLLDVVNGSYLRAAADAAPSSSVSVQTLLLTLLESWA